MVKMNQKIQVQAYILSSKLKLDSTKLQKISI